MGNKRVIPKDFIKENSEKMSVFGVFLDDMTKEEVIACVVYLCKEKERVIKTFNLDLMRR